MYSSYGELCTEVYDLSKPLGYFIGDVEFYMDRLSDVIMWQSRFGDAGLRKCCSIRPKHTQNGQKQKDWNWPRHLIMKRPRDYTCGVAIRKIKNFIIIF